MHQMTLITFSRSFSYPENKDRKWFILKDAITKLNHRPVQQSYLTSILGNNQIKDVYSIGNLLG